MNLMDYIYYAFVTYLIYIVFFGLIAIFGYLILIFLRNKDKKDWNLSKLELIFISFAIGIGLYLTLAYSLLTLKIFNFFTAYLPIIILDILCVVYYFKKKKIQLDLSKFKDFIVLRKKSLLLSLLIFSIITSLQFIEFWAILIDNSSLLARDTYKWTAKVWFILDNGNINHNFFNNPLYPEGFPVICAGTLMISPTKTISYFFMKFGGMPILSTYILALYTISKRFFKQNFFLIFSCLTFLLIYRYIMYRTIIFLPSSIANLLIFISLIIILTKIPNYLLGFIIPAIYLIHVLSALFLIFSLGIFYFIKFFKSFGELKPFFREIISMIFLIIILLIPFLIYSYIVFEIDIFSILPYIKSLIPQSSHNIYQFSNIKLGNSIQNQWINDFLNIIYNERTKDLFNLYTIGPFLLLSLGALLIITKKRKSNTKDFILILKVGLVLTIIIFYFGFLISEYFQSKFYAYAIYRSLETFFPHIILLASLTIETLVKKSVYLWNFLRIKYSHLIFSNRVKWIFNKINFKLILMISVITSSLFYYSIREDIQPNYYYLTLPEVILYVNNNIPQGANLSVPHSEDSNNDLYDIVYVLLNNFNLFYYHCNSTLIYSDFYDFCLSNNIEFILLKKICLNFSTFLEEFESSSNFIKIYQIEDSELHFGIYEFVQ